MCNNCAQCDAHTVYWLALAFLWLYCVLQLICVRFSFFGIIFCYSLFVYVCFYCVRFCFFNTMPRDWLGRMRQKLTCRYGICRCNVGCLWHVGRWCKVERLQQPVRQIYDGADCWRCCDWESHYMADGKLSSALCHLYSPLTVISWSPYMLFTSYFFLIVVRRWYSLLVPLTRIYPCS